MGAVTDNGCCSVLKGEGQDVTGVFLKVDTIKENAGVGHCLIATVTECGRERSERGFSESLDEWWGRGQGAGVNQEDDPVRFAQDRGELKWADGRSCEASKAGAAPESSQNAVCWAEFCPAVRTPAE